MSASFSSIPEELVERILSLVFTEQSPSPVPRPSWHPYTPRPQSPPSLNRPSRLSPLLVSHTWLRIATPLYYRSILLRTPRQATAFASFLKCNPELAQWVRALRVEGSFGALGDVVRRCKSLDEFDMTVDNGAMAQYAIPGGLVTVEQAGEVEEDVKIFCEGLTHIKNLKHLTIRKNGYLTQAGPALIFEHLSDVIKRWDALESVNIAFRFSPTASAAGFAASLAKAPHLRTLYAALPAIWNTTLLEISSNPSLTSIHLSPTTEIAQSHLFLSEARKHSRLIELIRAGTPMFRARAHTTVGVPWPPVLRNRGQQKAQAQAVVEEEVVDIHGEAQVGPSQPRQHRASVSAKRGSIWASPSRSHVEAGSSSNPYANADVSVNTSVRRGQSSQHGRGSKALRRMSAV